MSNYFSQDEIEKLAQIQKEYEKKLIEDFLNRLKDINNEKT